jgi:hypothetical protein
VDLIVKIYIVKLCLRLLIRSKIAKRYKNIYNIRGVLMRWQVLVLMLLLGLAQGYPLHASNGILESTVFGAFKDPWTSGDANADRYMVLVVDLGLMRDNASDSAPIKAVYSLTDGNDRVYRNEPGLTRDIGPRRSLIGFVVPREAIPKTLTIDPSAFAGDGEQFSVLFNELTNSTNGNVTMIYYGVLRSALSNNRKNIEFDIGIANNGTEKLPLSAKNFTLVDQWDWIYSGSKQYDSYSPAFPTTVLPPNGSIRSRLVFGPLSPLSRPVKLVYAYSNNSTLSLDIDSEGGLHSGDASPQSCSECAKAQEDKTLAGSIKATKARLAKVRESLTGNETSKGNDEL